MLLLCITCDGKISTSGCCEDNNLQFDRIASAKVRNSQTKTVGEDLVGCLNFDDKSGSSLEDDSGLEDAGHHWIKMF